MTRNINQLENEIIELRENLATMDARDPDMLDVLDRLRINREELDFMLEYNHDLECAIQLLIKHGIAYQLFTKDDVWAKVESLPGGKENDIHNIVKHVMEGDDWSSVSNPTIVPDTMIWNIISGTAHDHPEWFTPAARAKL